LTKGVREEGVNRKEEGAEKWAQGELPVRAAESNCWRKVAFRSFALSRELDERSKGEFARRLEHASC
jgi:hypothetical protein